MNSIKENKKNDNKVGRRTGLGCGLPVQLCTETQKFKIQPNPNIKENKKINNKVGRRTGLGNGSWMWVKAFPDADNT